MSKDYELFPQVLSDDYDFFRRIYIFLLKVFKVLQNFGKKMGLNFFIFKFISKGL